MDKRLQLIAHLYGEEIDGLEPLDALLEDPDLHREFRLLQEARFALDHRKRARPDPGAIEAVLAAARPPNAGRPPLRLVRLRRVLVPMTAVAAVLLVFILNMPLTQRSDPAVAPAEMEEATADVASAESLLRSLPPAAPEPAPAALAEAKSEAGPAGEEASWGSGRDVRPLSRRIAMLRSAGVDAWDGDAVPLEMLPEETGNRDLLPAGARRPGN